MKQKGRFPETIIISPPIVFLTQILDKLSLRKEKRINKHIGVIVMKNAWIKQIHKVPGTFPFVLSGSLTVETALVLPIFMFMLISLMSFCRVMEYSDTVLSGLHQSARGMAAKAYISSAAGVGDLGGMSRIAGIALSEGYVSGKVQNRLNVKGFSDGSISYMRSEIMSSDMIDLIAVEEIPLLYGFLGKSTLRVMDRARVHAFTGYDNTRGVNSGVNEEIVYITASGSVYHRSRNCSHLKVQVSSVAAGVIENMRSAQGAKYYECEYCHKNSGAGNYYITDYGNRYHTTVNCQALKRDISAVPVSKVSGRSACKSCGGG